jgi:fluoride exporter
MLNIIYVGTGGFIGAVARYLLSRYLGSLLPSFPLGTLAVNVIGSFILGLIMYYFTPGKNISPELRDFITIGILGGFTTMSAFAYESFKLFELNQMLLFALNLALNLVLCILAVYAGKELAVFIAK